MADIYDLIDPATLTEIARLALADEDRPENADSLAPWFPSVTSDTISFEWRKGSTRDFTAAVPFRAFSTPPVIGTRPGFTIASGQMPPMSIEYPLTEYDRIKQREAERGRPIVGDIFENEVFADIARGIRAAYARMSLAAADLLATGTCVIAENGVQLTLDSQRPAGRESTVGTAWSNTATATPMNDEEAVLDVLADEEGLGIDDLVVITNRATWREYKATDQVIAAYNSNRLLDRVSTDQARQVREENDFPEVMVMNRQIRNAAGTLRRMIPDGVWIYVPRTAVGEMVWGTPPIADEPEITLEQDDRPGPIAYLTRQVKPLLVSTVVEAIGVPLLKDPEATYALTV